MENRLKALRNAEGRLTGVYGVSHDISERKQAEEEREKLQAQLNQAQKMESIGRLAGGVAHDFNNMLNIIIGHVGMTLDDLPNNSPLRPGLEEAQKAAHHSADITRQLLAFARKQTILPRVLDLNQTVESMLKMLRHLIGENITLSWQPGPGLWPVSVDPSQIDQILANLCVNAKDAIEEVGKGTGLGLSTVYGIVKQNNGFIYVYSEPDLGTTIKIYLPRHTAEIKPTTETTISKPVPRGTETILLVEDEPAILRMTISMLKRQGYRVLSASKPEAAIRLCQEHGEEIHLLVTDGIMPEMNGRDLATKLSSTYPDLQYLFMSGYPDSMITGNGLLDAGVHYIQKPFTHGDLATKVREVLDRQRVTTEE